MVTAPVLAKKIEFLTAKVTAASSFLADRDVIRVCDGNEVQQAGDDNEFRSIIRGGEGDFALSPIHGQRQNVKTARTHVAYKTKNVEDIPAVGFINAALHRQSKHEQGGDRNKQQQAADPALLDHVSSARDKPAHCGGEHSHCADWLRWYDSVFLSRGIWHSDVHYLTLDFSRHFGRLGAHKNIDLATYAEFRQINSGFDREAGIGKNLPLVVNFEVVHVCTVGMDVGADGMPGAV